VTIPSEATTDQEQELAELRARVASLELELFEVQQRANAVVAAAQDRAYWLDRWHLDLNALMRRRGAAEFRALLRAVRAVGRLFKRTSRRLRG
jgi:ABC-type transporter Mla subunit MlaD